jgi:hypothetical protein
MAGRLTNHFRTPSNYLRAPAPAIIRMIKRTTINANPPPYPPPPDMKFPPSRKLLYTICIGLVRGMGRQVKAQKKKGTT